MYVMRGNGVGCRMWDDVYYVMFWGNGMVW